MYFNPIPEYLTTHIVIHKDHKKEIRRQLSKYFNISTATIYPEVNNIVDRNNYVTEFYAQERKSLLKTDITQIYERAMQKITFDVNQNLSILQQVYEDYKHKETLDAELYLKTMVEMLKGVQNVELSIKMTLREFAQGELKLKDAYKKERTDEIKEALKLITNQQECLHRHIESSFKRLHLDINAISKNLKQKITGCIRYINLIEKRNLSTWPNGYFRKYYNQHKIFLGERDD